MISRKSYSARNNDIPLERWLEDAGATSEQVRLLIVDPELGGTLDWNDISKLYAWAFLREPHGLELTRSYIISAKEQFDLTHDKDLIRKAYEMCKTLVEAMHGIDSYRLYSEVASRRCLVDSKYTRSDCIKTISKAIAYCGFDCRLAWQRIIIEYKGSCWESVLKDCADIFSEKFSGLRVWEELKVIECWAVAAHHLGDGNTLSKAIFLFETRVSRLSEDEAYDAVIDLDELMSIYPHLEDSLADSVRGILNYSGKIHYYSLFS